MTLAEARGQYKQVFDYDHVPVEYPAGVMSRFDPCAIKTGGYCTKTLLLDYVETLTDNVFSIC